MKGQNETSESAVETHKRSILRLAFNAYDDNNYNKTIKYIIHLDKQ